MEMPVSTPLKQFLAVLATDPDTLAEHLRNPDEVMHEAGLSQEDIAALTSRNPSALEARLDDGGPNGDAEDPPSSPGTSAADPRSISRRSVAPVVYDPLPCRNTVTHSVSVECLEKGSPTGSPKRRVETSRAQPSWTE
jgi:hypothetical protein